MTFDTNWDVEKYRTDYESEEHWDLKCKFISSHKEKFPEDELICLAQVFFNVEFLGCKYPLETMKLVAELSKDVAKEFRDSRKNRLQRTFVTASTAIEAKYKEKFIPEQKTLNKDTVFKNEQTTFRMKNKIAFVSATTSTNCEAPENKITPKLSEPDVIPPLIQQNIKLPAQNLPDTVNKKKRKRNKKQQLQCDKCGSKIQKICQIDASKNQNISKVISSNVIAQTKITSPTIPSTSSNTTWLTLIDLKKFLPKFIIYESDTVPASILYTSCKKNKLNCGFVKKLIDSKYQIIFTINNMDVAMGETKFDAADKVLNELRKYCFTIKVKNKFFSNKTTVSKDDTAFRNNDQIQREASQSGIKLDENNRGFHLMKSLGWSGGALGSRSSGILAPIEAEMKIGRTGFGHEKAFNSKKIRDLLMEYIRCNDFCDLIFSNDFSKDERASIHMMAKKLKLKSISYGKESERHLVVSRTDQIQDLLKYLLGKDNGLSEKYEVIYPGQK